MDEMVALYDRAGSPAGSAPRSRVRAENLRHAATAVVVRDRMGRVYVHRRTPTKDVYPGLLDFAAGGVVQAGEDPAAAAVRELAEELGVTDTPLEPVRDADYIDDHTDYRGFCYVTGYEGPLRWQPEEVAWGAWMSLEQLGEMLAIRPGDFVPDTRGLLGDWVRDRLADRVRVAQGWDSETEIVEGRWVDRRPRRPEVAEQLLLETRLLPAIAPRLPLEVPVPGVLDEQPLRVRHPLVTGAPSPSTLTPADGAALGEFLRSLHGTEIALATEAGVPSATSAFDELRSTLERFAAQVLPMLPAEHRDAGRSLLEAASTVAPETALVHGDLGPAHLLSVDGRVAGVIDWGDARVFDPAIDLAWTLHGAPAGFADALAAAYRVTPEQRRRGMVWHRLGPWHEVLWGLGDGGREYVGSGLAGVLTRLQ